MQRAGHLVITECICIPSADHRSHSVRVITEGGMKSLPCAVFFLCCTHRRVTRAQEYTVISLETGIVPISAPVEVSCVFTNQWTSQRHPLAYPPAARARWSSMILASHSSDYTMWANGDIASPAIQTLAEVGLLLILCTELTVYPF